MLRIRITKSFHTGKEIMDFLAKIVYDLSNENPPKKGSGWVLYDATLGEDQSLEGTAIELKDLINRLERHIGYIQEDRKMENAITREMAERFAANRNLIEGITRDNNAMKGYVDARLLNLVNEEGGKELKYIKIYKLTWFLGGVGAYMFGRMILHWCFPFAFPTLF